MKPSLQIQGRAYLESKHASSLAQLTTALESETWLAVEVSQSSQAVITGILHQADFASTMAVTKGQVPGCHSAEIPI